MLSACVFPNPADRSIVEVKIDHFVPDSNYEATVYDAFGRVITSQVMRIEKESIRIGDQASIYFIRIAENGRVICSKRVIRL